MSLLCVFSFFLLFNHFWEMVQRNTKCINEGGLSKEKHGETTCFEALWGERTQITTHALLWTAFRLLFPTRSYKHQRQMLKCFNVNQIPVLLSPLAPGANLIIYNSVMKTLRWTKSLEFLAQLPGFGNALLVIFCIIFTSAIF